MLNSTHYQLRDLENKVLLSMFHTNWLKLAFGSKPAGIFNTWKQLTKAIHGTNTNNSIENTASNIKFMQR